MRTTLLVGLCFGSIFAARPFVTDDAGTVPAQQFQFESGLEIQDQNQSPAFAIKHGITPYFDLGMSLSSSTMPWKSDCNNGHNLMLKFALWPQHLALSTATDLQSGLTVWNGIASTAVAGMELHANLAAEMDTSSTELDYGLLLRKTWKYFAVGGEVFGCSVEKPNVQIGMQWLPSEWANLDLGTVYGFDNKTWQVNAGLSLNFGFGGTNAAQ